MRIFVASLNYSTVTETELFELFSRHVDVRSAKLARDAAGRSKGYGFVELVNDADVGRALELDGYLFHNRRIGVALAEERG